MTDTDSLVYHITTTNIYENMKENLTLYDTSNFPLNNSCYSNINKKVLGKMKDEMNGKPILEFIGLRAKLYSILMTDEEKQTAKGAPRVAIKQQLSHKDYKACLESHQLKYSVATNIRSELHRIYSVKHQKLKRYVLNCGKETLAYGHYKINEINNPHIVHDHSYSSKRKREDDGLKTKEIRLKYNKLIILVKPCLYNQSFSRLQVSRERDSVTPSAHTLHA